MTPEKDDEDAKASLPPTTNAPATKAASRLMCASVYQRHTQRDSEVCLAESTKPRAESCAGQARGGTATRGGHFRL